jgi:hypothetical protein
MLCAAASLSVVFLLNYNFILSHYFRGGAYVLDSSWFGSLVHEPEVFLKNPLILRKEEATPFFYATHVAAIHVFIGLATHLIAMNTVYIAAIYFAAVYTFLSAVFGFLLWKMFDGIPLQWPSWAMALIMAAGAAIAVFLRSRPQRSRVPPLRVSHRRIWCTFILSYRSEALCLCVNVRPARSADERRCGTASVSVFPGLG